MKFLAPFAVLALISVLAESTAHAQRTLNIQARTAADLADLCAANPKEPQGDAKINYCHGYAQGAIAVELRHAGDKKPFCFPNPAPTRTATMSEFVGWVRSLPEHRNETALDGLFKFLAERFPCK
jgi:Rap1a immunity proteins